MSEFQILMKHALPNALLPVITIIGNGMGMLLAGTVVIEMIFGIPGDRLVPGGWDWQPGY